MKIKEVAYYCPKEGANVLAHIGLLDKNKGIIKNITFSTDMRLVFLEFDNGLHEIIYRPITLQYYE